MKNSAKIFLLWLKEHDCYGQYKENFISYRLHCSFSTFISEYIPYSYLSSAFFWADTSQGWDYWQELNWKWVDFLEEKEII
jgi:hypothetical protein